jgi:hypothetical protein
VMIKTPPPDPAMLYDVLLLSWCGRDFYHSLGALRFLLEVVLEVENMGVCISKRSKIFEPPNRFILLQENGTTTSEFRLVSSEHDASEFLFGVA